MSSFSLFLRTWLKREASRIMMKTSASALHSGGMKGKGVLPSDVSLHQHSAWYQHLLTLSSGLEPIRTAVVHLVDGNALMGAIEAAQAKLIIPILVGP
jgi:hypothetical protein